jgi:FtsZ-binding cell division protein ZapB
MSRQDKIQKATKRIESILLEISELNKEKAKLEKMITSHLTRKEVHEQKEVQFVQLGYSYDQMCER